MSQFQGRIERSAVDIPSLDKHSIIRPDGELPKLQWSDVKLAEKTVVIRPEVAKGGRRRRFVAISPNAIAWLRVYQLAGGRREGPVTPYEKSQLTKKRRELQSTAGLSRWIQQGMRHSFCSYWLAAYEREQARAAERPHGCGNNVAALPQRDHESGREEVLGDPAGESCGERYSFPEGGQWIRIWIARNGTFRVVRNLLPRNRTSAFLSRAITSNSWPMRFDSRPHSSTVITALRMDGRCRVGRSWSAKNRWTVIMVLPVSRSSLRRISTAFAVGAKTMCCLPVACTP